MTPEPGERPAVTIATTDGYRLRVSGVGPPVPLEYSSKAGDRIVFDQYDAPVTLELIEDLQCPACKAFESEAGHDGHRQDTNDQRDATVATCFGLIQARVHDLAMRIVSGQHFGREDRSARS